VLVIRSGTVEEGSQFNGSASIEQRAGTIQLTIRKGLAEVA